MHELKEIKRMKKQKPPTAEKMSASRRRFLVAMLKAGVSIGALGSIPRLGMASEERRGPIEAEYDYIVVGSGSAGAIVSSRLCEAGMSVLLVEAGSGDANQPKHTEADLWMENIGTETDWNIPTVAQRGMKGREIGIAAGKVLGGSSNINAMFWLKPDVRDLFRLRNVSGSAFDENRFNQALERIEKYLPGGEGRSLNGRISVGRYAQENPLSSAAIEASLEVGAPAKDHNAHDFIDGVGLADVNITPEGKRSGPAQTYLADALERDNFELAECSLVTRLIVDNGSCIGVEFFKGGSLQSVYARNEVVVCAGAIGSPKLLMLSGIGPENELRRLGIRSNTILKAVGKNLQDHVFLEGIAYEPGPLYSSDVTLGRIATHSFHTTAPNSQAPNIQIMCMQTPFPPGTTSSGAGFSLLPWASKVESAGSVTLKSADPRVDPIVDPAYLSKRSDIETLSVAAEIALEIGQSNALSGYRASRNDNSLRLRGRGNLIRYIREKASPGLHLVGTCSAGLDPSSSVVSEDFKVWGVDGLRVVDGSVLAEVPGVNTQVTIMTIAEIASDLLLGN